jgi:hypothetical protein
MGCAILLAYVVRCRLSCERKINGGMDGLDHHHFSNVVLMAPAGVHRNSALQWDLVLGSFGKLANMMCLPDDFPFPYSPRDMHEPVAHFLDYAKQSHRIVKQMVSVAGNFMMGGGSQYFPLVNGVNLSVYPIGRTSIKVIRHGLQCKDQGLFLAYDHGSDAENLNRYGQVQPPNYLDFYDVIDVPVSFCAGGDDRLIPAEDVLLHYEYLRKVSPQLASYKEFPRAGHLSFTIGQDAAEWKSIVQHVLDEIVRDDMDNDTCKHDRRTNRNIDFSWGFTKITEDFRPIHRDNSEGYSSFVIRFSKNLLKSSGAWAFGMLPNPLARSLPVH